MFGYLKGFFQVVGIAWLWAKWKERRRMRREIKKSIALNQREEEARLSQEAKKTESEVDRMSNEEVDAELRDRWSRK